ncbi:MULTISPECIES: MarR family winged helix-turn-helix transcriptional regulator [Thermomonosporaceae]|uniref:MarR family winged helix-turn-helix transcriptional regulator n=1 Tax=Thermomonosporaceae TaxID=2012 RepID=UPI00255AC334|nr:MULTISPECIES: MarR family transcriptional regulator [Thermomonosporaceae]MDL4777810.1 MarR family transcriptional regulator [Actinomadura xylanilytica]
MDDELADLFLRAARRMRGRQVEHLAPLGLTPAQARALRVIVRADAPPRMAELATLLGVVPRSVTTLVDALEEAGLVTRTPDPANRRSTLVVPTAEGRAIRARMASVRREVAEEVLAPLSAGQRETLRELLAVIDTAAPCGPSRRRRGHLGPADPR